MFETNWYYNPNCFTPQTYAQIQAQQYEQSQRKEVYNAIKAYKDFLDAIEKLDPMHQHDVFCGCICEVGKRRHW